MFKRLFWATICLPFPALLADSVLGYDYSISAPFPSSVSGALKSTTLPVLTVSRTVTSPTANGTIFGKATFGNLYASAEANAFGSKDPPDVATEADVDVFFSDSLTFVSSTSPSGTPVDYLITATLNDSFNFTPTDPYVASNSCDPIHQSISSVVETVGILADSPCNIRSTQTTSASFTSTVGAQVGLNAILEIFARADTALVLNGVLYSSPVDMVTLDAGHTATVTVQVLTPGVSFVSASGATYSAAAVPEPATAWLTLGVLITLACRRTYCARRLSACRRILRIASPI